MTIREMDRQRPSTINGTTSATTTTDNQPSNDIIHHQQSTMTTEYQPSPKKLCTHKHDHDQKTRYAKHHSPSPNPPSTRSGSRSPSAVIQTNPLSSVNPSIKSQSLPNVKCQVRCRIPIDARLLSHPDLVFSNPLAALASASSSSTSSSVSPSSIQPHNNNITLDSDPVCYLHLYTNDRDTVEHLAIVFGTSIQSNSLETAWKEDETELDRLIRGASITKTQQQNGKPKIITTPPLCRIHSSCFTGETIGSIRCDCGDQLKEAMRQMALANHGVIVYLLQEGRGIGLADKLRAYNLQDLGHDTVTANLLLSHPPDRRSYEVAISILSDLGIEKVSLLTNNPDKMQGLVRYGIEVVERVGMMPPRWNRLLRQTKIGSSEQEDGGCSSSISMSVTKSMVVTPSNSPPPNPLETDMNSLAPAMLQKGNSGVASASTSSTSLTTSTTISSSIATTSADSNTKLKELDRYLMTKINKMNHLIDIPPAILSQHQDEEASSTELTKKE